MNYRTDDIVKSCPRLESGLRLGPEGLRACQMGSFASPIYWSAAETARTKITKQMIVAKRKWLLALLNDKHSDITCKRCMMVRTKRYGDIDFTKLGQVDLAATTICNLRCKFCYFTQENLFRKAEYDDLAILREFKEEDIEWDAVVDFNGGEPALLSNLYEYFDFFASQRIRVRFMTNGVEYHQSVYDGLAEGLIQWVVTSVDAGTPSTYRRIKKRNKYLQVLENMTRYAHAGSGSGGRLAIKYIFCGDNCSDDDIAGFTYAMLAIRPHQVWLTFDFSKLVGLPADQEEFGGHDFSKDIEAYVKMYRMMKKHGITPVHYSIGHLAAMCVQGKILLESVMQEIEKPTRLNRASDLLLGNFRHKEESSPIPTAHFNTGPLRIKKPNQQSKPWSLCDKRVLIAPACSSAIDLLADQTIKDSQVLGFVDRDPLLRGKSTNGYAIHGYDAIPDLDPEVILVAAPQQHKADIIRQIAKYTSDIERIAVFEQP